MNLMELPTHGSQRKTESVEREKISPTSPEDVVVGLEDGKSAN